MRRKTALVPVVVLIACASTQVTPLGPGKQRPAISPDQVSIYRTISQVTGKFEEVALIETTQPTGYSDATMLEDMRRRAAAIGANGLVIEDIEHPGTFRRTMMPLSSSRVGK